MKTIFLFAGQGSQCVGMGKDMYERFSEYREVVDKVDASYKYKKLMDDGPLEELSETSNTQPAMSIFAAGVVNVLKAHGITPDIAFGLSLGEYGALYTAGVFSLEDYIDVITYRGKVMSEAAEGLECAMSAVLGLESSAVEEVVSKYDNVTIANYNCPGQYVICGDEEGVAAAEKELAEAGAKRCVRVNVSGPFHTSYMKPAGDRLADKLKSTDMKQAEIPVIMNVTGDYSDGNPDTIRELLEKQVQSSVHLEESIKRVLGEDECKFIEIGPGKTMSGFVKKTAKVMSVNPECYTISTAEDLSKIISD